MTIAELRWKAEHYTLGDGQDEGAISSLYNILHGISVYSPAYVEAWCTAGRGDKAVADAKKIIINNGKALRAIRKSGLRVYWVDSDNTVADIQKAYDMAVTFMEASA